MSLIHTCAACDAIIDPCVPHNCRSQQTGDIFTASSIYSGKETTMDDWKADERTALAMIDALPPALHSGKESVHFDVYEYRVAARKALKAFLPKPDPAKALVDEYLTSPRCDGDKYYGQFGMAANKQFARWLIENDRIK
jgi:hypothetical protein